MVQLEAIDSTRKAKSFRQESERLNPEGPETVEGLKSRSACDLPAAVRAPEER